LPEFDAETVKLGKAPVKTDVRTLLFARYVDTTVLPAPPEELDVADQVPTWPMYANDRIGDCTCAAAAHMVEAWTGEDTGEAVVIPEEEVLRAFDAVKVVDEDGEEGAIELDVLNHWRKAGVGNHQIVAFARVPTYDRLLVCTAAYVFGGLYIGLQLPASAKHQAVWGWKRRP
jgi:hypothetical protein